MNLLELKVQRYLEVHSMNPLEDAASEKKTRQINYLIKHVGKMEMYFNFTLLHPKLPDELSVSA
jgi:hypothetical protein